jgi:hypothetical protein
LWKVTRSIRPEISSVAGLRSGIAAFMCGDSFSHGRSALGDPFGKAILLGFGCPEGVRVGWGVSEVQAAFVTTLATVYGNHDDRALRLDRLLAGSSLHRFHYPRRNSVRRERLVDGRNNPFAFPQTRLGHLYAMTPLVFPAASTGARCVSNYDFHGSPYMALWSPAEFSQKQESRLTTRIGEGQVLVARSTFGKRT